MRVRISRIVPAARAPARAAAFALYTIARLGAVTTHQVAVPRAKRAGVFDSHMRAWCRRLLDMFGVQVIVEPGAPPPANGARLVVANHRSPADIIVLLTLFGGQFLGQAAVSRWPIIGAAARRAGTVWVDRERGTSGASAIRAMRRRLQHGATMLVFPEGTTFAGDEVHPFRAGALRAVLGLDVEIIPVGLAYDEGVEWVDGTFLEHMMKIAGRKGTKVAVKVGGPIRAGSDTRTAALARELHSAVQQLVREAREIHTRA
jgi:1-acyl-sn-glycerol-3-phosphate acyltransferase